MPLAKKKTPQPKSGKAVIYARYSSHNQREASLEQQIAECKKYASPVERMTGRPSSV